MAADHVGATPAAPGTVLLVANDAIIRLDLAAEFEDHGFTVIESNVASTALETLRAKRVDAVVIDADLPGDMSGHDFVEALRRQRPNCPVVMLTARLGVPSACSDRLVVIESKPYRLERIVLALKAADLNRRARLKSAR